MPFLSYNRNIILTIWLVYAGTLYTQQSYKVSDTFPFKWINKKWRDGFYVTSMATAGNKWAIVMSRNAGFSEQVSSFALVVFVYFDTAKLSSVILFILHSLFVMHLFSRLLSWTSCTLVRESIRGGIVVTE